MTDKLLDKLSKLLRQSERASTVEEADAFLQKAQQIATINSIDLAVARSHQAAKDRREIPIQKRITIGTRGKHGLKHYVNLFLTIARQNEVKCNIAHNSSYVVAFGFPSDIEVVEALYSSLVYQLVESSNKFIQSGAHKSEIVQVDKYEYEVNYWGRRERVWVGTVSKPVDARVARASFQEAFISKINERLGDARREAVKAFTENPEHVSTGAELVLVAKAVEVADFYKQTSDARGLWGGNRRSSSGSSRSGRTAGREAGSSARVGGERAITGGQRQVGSGR